MILPPGTCFHTCNKKVLSRSTIACFMKTRILKTGKLPGHFSILTISFSHEFHQEIGDLGSRGSRIFKAHTMNSSVGEIPNLFLI